MSKNKLIAASKLLCRVNGPAACVVTFKTARRASTNLTAHCNYLFIYRRFCVRVSKTLILFHSSVNKYCVAEYQLTFYPYRILPLCRHSINQKEVGNGLFWMLNFSLSQQRLSSGL